MASDNTGASGAAVHFEHYCQAPGCKKWGSFGYPSPRGRGESDFYCFAHRPDKAEGVTQ
ncbi:hypothetical protein SAMN05880590_102786 [Rhizobium sp. RU35A]|uniref:hypothetical protein n=1 Tax=Rhizobium sp. RU35A TaxID=1907414 RepID=UPI000953CF42|nr:hypothetical protein [Rhizobium sp. RU35A]SIQ24841.1 hypothetical protein SAMN05880590_102786 [Rhizobium sp. RU35A]